MFFIIETRKGDGDTLAAWWEFERHPALWTARNRVRIMLQDSPRLRGRLRIIGCTPLDAVNKEWE